ncbi:MAG: chemotaxis protein CheA [Syntrophobacteraceae bacterium]|nr:chemotaxis protein CheA [Syntrophobacteraceae bacterium]
MATEDFFQEYMDEVKEHLQELESSLLVLEHQGTDRESIGRIFRAVHSIKGASAYMGFEQLAHLTHELESRINEMQVHATTVTPQGISCLLECVDFISHALNHLQETGAEPPVPESLLEKMSAMLVSHPEADAAKASPGDEGSRAGDRGCGEESEVPGSDGESMVLSASGSHLPKAAADGTEVGPEEIVEEDQEIYGIYLSSFQERLASLARILAVPAETVLSTEEGEKGVGLLTELISSSRYMDYEQVVEVLDRWRNSLEKALREGRLDRECFRQHLEFHGRKLAGMLPGLQLPAVENTEIGRGETCGKIQEEEDEELFSIFLDSMGQSLSQLAAIRPQPPGNFLTPAQVENALAFIQRMISAAGYMDYGEITDSLRDWKESLGEPGMTGPVSFDTYSRLLQDHGRRLRYMLPGLNLDLPGFEEGQEPLSDALEKEIEASLGELDRVLTSDAGGSRIRGDASPLDAFEEESKGKETEDGRKPAPSLESEKPVPKKDRIPVFAEELPSSVTLRVDAQKVDQLLNQLGELVVTRSEFIQTSASFRDMLRELAAQGKLTKQELRRFRLLSFRLNESTLSLGRVANDLQASVMRIRMLPISQLFQRFPRVVRDQALKHGKKVELRVEGGETEMDKRVLEQMNDPLVQFLRNAIAHGIETPEERLRAGKPITGTIRLAAYHAGDYVALEIEDDGRGIDVQKLRHVLQDRRDIASQELNRLSDQELIYAVFLPGVSTQERVDGSAGRGVGLDVVKENVERMNGSIQVDSFPGQGTRFTIWIPLTVAIIRALLVKAGAQIFTLPLTSVSEIHRYRQDETHSIEGFEVITLRGKTIPLVHLGQLLGMSPEGSDRGHRFIVIVSTRFQEVGLVVDGLMGEREVVIKGIEDGVHTFEGFSGATILGDGTVSLILDVSTLLRNMKQAATPTPYTGPEEATVH